jgi:hypothetical protein
MQAFEKIGAVEQQAELRSNSAAGNKWWISSSFGTT